MSSARCSSCHCYSRGCPEGMPNHRHSGTVGHYCTMNAQGRHYRDQTDIANPVCDYESKGQRCEFYSSNNEHSQIPYPEDISLGPTVQNDGRNTDLAQILEMLQQQKQQNDNKFAEIQRQVNALALQNGPIVSEGEAISTTSVVMTLATFSNKKNKKMAAVLTSLSVI